MVRMHIIQQNIEELIQAIKLYMPLMNSHMVDYFSKNAYENCIPQAIRDEIENIGYDNAINFILCHNTKMNLPNLHNFIGMSKNYALCNKDKLCLSITELEKKLTELGCDNKTGLQLKVFMNSKKSHEVEVLSAVIASLKTIGNISHLVDIGDGKGYLSSLLSLHYKIPVLGIDASVINTTGAIKRVEKLGKVWHGIINTNRSMLPKSEIKFNSNNLLYKQITQFVTDETDIKQFVNNVFMDDIAGLGVVGLHTCGNLAPAALRIFAKNPDIKMLCNVSCCYHLLTEKNLNSDSAESFGFPLSTFLIDKNYYLGRTARMLSAQSTDRILNKKELPNRNIFYRAVLEVLLKRHFPDMNERHVGRIKITNVPFTVYASKALQKLRVTDISENDINIVYGRFIHREKELYTFTLLRCMLAPLIESLVLLDRLLYLHECGFENSYLVQFFDAVISPRCYGIVSYKSI